MNTKKQNVILIILIIFSFLFRLGLALNEYYQNGTRDWADAKLYYI